MYDFLNLSPYEFEQLSCDLLSKQFGVMFESFCLGPDQGIDLRYVGDGNQFTAQCKRYAHFKDLASILKKERKKLDQYKPKGKYLLLTSVQLTPRRKDKLISILNPYLTSPSQIYGHGEINKLLRDNKEIEQAHVKLWMTSSGILERILASKVYNTSSFEEEVIKQNSKIYVQGDCFAEALSILEKNRFVIISGIPGIGKTTLGRILTYHFLGMGFEDFIFLSEDIEDGISVYKEGRKQIFLYDDFLGRNFLEDRLRKNEDQRIIKFIDKIRKAGDKVLIMTTREYILNQAKEKYDSFDTNDIDLSKCIVDLSKYSFLVRAQILYNHLFFSPLPKAYIEPLMKKENYLRIVDHQSYSPRIIETITQHNFLRDISAEKFVDSFVECLDNPVGIWKNVFETKITELSKLILINLVSCGSPIFLSDLEKAVLNFTRCHGKYGITFSHGDFHRSLKELENTFTKIMKDDGRIDFIDFQNPSIQDFLVNYIGCDPILIEDLILASTYFEQIFRLFSQKDRIYRVTIKIQEKMNEKINRKILEEFDKLEMCTLIRIYQDGKYCFMKKAICEGPEYEILWKLNTIEECVDLKRNPPLKEFIINHLKNIRLSKLRGDALRFYIDLIVLFFEESDIQDIEDFFNVIFDTVETIEDIKNVKRLEEIFYFEFDKYLASNPGVMRRIEEILQDETENCDSDFADGVIRDVEEIETLYSVDFSHIKCQLEEKVQQAEIEALDRKYFTTSQGTHEDKSESNVDEVELMFSSLKQKFK